MNEFGGALALAEAEKLIPPDPGPTKRLADAILETDHFAVDAGGKLYVYVHGQYVPTGEHKIKVRVKALTTEWGQTKKWSVHRANEVIEYIRVDAPSLWDQPPENIINVANGLLDVTTVELKDHSPEHLTPFQLPVEFHPGTQCPAWEIFAREVFPEDAQLLPW